MSGPLTETSKALTWSYDRRDDRIRTCDPLTPRSTQPCSPALKLPRDQLSHGAGGARLSPALSSPLSSLEGGQGLTALLLAALHLLPCLVLAADLVAVLKSTVAEGHRTATGSAIYFDIAAWMILSPMRGAVRLTDPFQRLLILAGLHRSQHPAHAHQHRT
jgi:hypothetical protein